MIPNIVKGSGITGALRYAMGQGNDAQTGKRLELVPGETSRASILGGQNFGFEIDSDDRLELARRMMEWQGLPENQTSKTRKLERDCFHASLSWGDGEAPDRAEMVEAAQTFLKAVGLEKARAVFIAHDDTDHAHLHVVASRVDPETGRSLTLDNDYVAGQKWAVQWDREHGPERGPPSRPLAALVAAVESRDAEGVLSYLTRDKATFQGWEVNRALAYGDMGEDERGKFRAQILGQENVIGLRETPQSEVSRYTTREVLAAEMALQRSAMQLEKNARFGIDGAAIDAAAKDFTLKPEQDAGLRRLTGAEGFAMLWGEAGTGKSHTLNATRAAYEAEGRNVIGLAWTNDVAQQMRGDGFKQAGTIAGELLALDNGRTSWKRGTVLIVDEAAMVSTENLAKLAGAAQEAGAKLILAGDDKQLSSIERGGMFETLRQTHGAATLRDVQRVKDDEQRAAFNGMHQGDFAQMLKVADERGGVHWTTRQSDTLKEMAARYTADLAADADPVSGHPVSEHGAGSAGKKRFMFAGTNKDVAALNEHARALHRAAGTLGEDHALPTKHGSQAFAAGDRIQFTGNGRTKAEKNAGLVNGRVGSVEAITLTDDAKPRVTVALDAAKGAKPQRVSFVVGDNAKAGEFNAFKHGYAGTIYRGQGRTLDETYLAHTGAWRASASYVALTRHREAVHIFAARETVKDLDAMARGMARIDNKRAATAYSIDAASAARAGLDKAVAAYSERPAPPRAARIDTGATVEATRTTGAGHRAAELGSAAKKGAAGAARALDGVADLAAKGIETIAETFASLLGGGSSAPPPQQAETPQPPPPAKAAQPDAAQRQTQADADARRARLLQRHSEEIPPERERDAEIARDRSGRERRRGE